METHADLMYRIREFSKALPENTEIRALMFAAYKRDWSEFEGILYGMHEFQKLSYNDPKTEDLKAMYDGIENWYTITLWEKGLV